MAPAKSFLGGLDALELIGVAVGGVGAAAIALIVTRGVAAVCAALASALLAPDERALLAARVEALEVTRSGAVESADARLRRLERDLHDGAQHRLAYIAMQLDRARSRLARDPDGAAELLAGAHRESKRAMSELRDLVRGIHLSGLRILEHVTEGLTTPARETSSNGARTLQLRSHCAFILSEECSVDYRISVPSGTTVRVSTGAGDITCAT